MAYIRHSPYSTWVVLLLTTLMLTACGPQEPTQAATTTVPQSETITRANTEPSLRVPTPTPTRIVAEASARAVETWAVVVTGPLNLRSGPSTDHTIEGTLNTNECRRMQDRTGDWMQLVSASGQVGWAHTDYLNTVSTCPTDTVPVLEQPVANVTDSWGIVSAALLNVRAGPDTAQTVLAQLVNGACIEVLDAQGSWLHVRNRDVMGWSSRDYIRLVDTCHATAPQPLVAQPVSAEPVAPAPVQPVVNTNTAVRVNATTITDTHIHECFGGGDSELRFVAAGTPIQVLGVGDWIAPINQYSAVGVPPYLKIRIWDGQYAWIAAAATNVDPSTQPVVPGVCEAYERLNWEVVEQARPTATATARPVIMRTPVPVRSCCKICTTGKACGNSCISRSNTCRVGPGTAYNG